MIHWLPQGADGDGASETHARAADAAETHDKNPWDESQQPGAEEFATASAATIQTTDDGRNAAATGPVWWCALLRVPGITSQDTREEIIPSPHKPGPEVLHKIHSHFTCVWKRGMYTDLYRAHSHFEMFDFVLLWLVQLEEKERKITLILHTFTVFNTYWTITLVDDNSKCGIPFLSIIYTTDRENKTRQCCSMNSRKGRCILYQWILCT